MPDKMNTNLACRAGRIRKGNCVRFVCRCFCGGETETKNKTTQKNKYRAKNKQIGIFLFAKSVV